MVISLQWIPTKVKWKRSLSTRWNSSPLRRRRAAPGTRLPPMEDWHPQIEGIGLTWFEWWICCTTWRCFLKEVLQDSSSYLGSLLTLWTMKAFLHQEIDLLLWNLRRGSNPKMPRIPSFFPHKFLMFGQKFWLVTSTANILVHIFQSTHVFDVQVLHNQIGWFISHSWLKGVMKTIPDLFPAEVSSLSTTPLSFLLWLP